MNKLALTAGILILAIGIALSGCNKGPENTVLASVNRTNITTTDFKKQFDELNPQLQQAVASDPAARKEFLENLILTELLLQEAKQLGLDKDAEYKKSMESHKKETEDYKKKLDQRLQDAAKSELINSVLKKAVGDKANQIAPPTDKEVRDYFNKNKDRIRAALGKQVSLKDIEPRIKMILIQEKQSKLSLDYANNLKAKAKISVNDKALDTALADLTRAPEMPEGLKAPATKKETK